MALTFYNTLTRTQEPFEPLDAKRVGMYGCGPTVYQLPHLGNYRSFLFFDLVQRYLEWKGYTVDAVMNLTDVDDKTINGALQAGIPLVDYTAPVAQAFFEDLRTLGVREASEYPRATQHVPQMVELIGELLEKGHAYKVGGSVYFDVASWPEYGKLSRVDLTAVREGAGLQERERQAIDPDELGKRDPRDFALWKAAKPADREVGAVWPTPWGEGRPGWHIECSAMGMAQLGDTFDIHIGGEDLIFPHHEDEIAQSEAASGKPFVRYWLHVKHLVIDGEKMSKSLGNFVTLRDLLEEGHSPAAIRYLLLGAHHRKELNFTRAGLADAREALRRLQDFEAKLGHHPTAADAAATRLPELSERALSEFEAAMDDDLNVAAALAALFTFVRESNSVLHAAGPVRPEELAGARRALERIDQVLGVLGLARESARVGQDLAAWVEERIEARQAARARRDFQAADAIRGELTAAGIVVEDTPQGPRWKRA
ncbi:MAG TPA: cysteine--tRNA ligase [Longimicrobiales bacterium]|nr:cysteine--tRNA ligase [Longimicrobiales bacterium]